VAPLTDVTARRFHPGPQRPPVDALDLQIVNGEFLRIRPGRERYFSPATPTRFPA
jgi:hypothetical protein